MPQLKSTSRVGVYIDASNVYRNGGSRMRYDVLREFACRDGSEVVRLNAYVSYDAERARVDPAYSTSVNKFFAGIVEPFQIFQKNDIICAHNCYLPLK